MHQRHDPKDGESKGGCILRPLWGPLPVRRRIHRAAYFAVARWTREGYLSPGVRETRPVVARWNREGHLSRDDRECTVLDRLVSFRCCAERGAENVGLHVRPVRAEGHLAAQDFDRPCRVRHRRIRQRAVIGCHHVVRARSCERLVMRFGPASGRDRQDCHRQQRVVRHRRASARLI